jgi:hypothetical protein
MLYFPHVHFIETIAQGESSVVKLRRNARKSFKEYTKHDPSYRLWTMIVPQRYGGNVSAVRLIVRVSRTHSSGDHLECSLRGYIYPNPKHSDAPQGTTKLYEQIIVNPRNMSYSDLDTEMRLGELQDITHRVAMNLSNDPILQLKAAASQRKASVPQ